MTSFTAHVNDTKFIVIAHSATGAVETEATPATLSEVVAAAEVVAPGRVQVRMHNTSAYAGIW